MSTQTDIIVLKIMRHEGGRMSAHGSGRKKRAAGQLHVGRAGELSVEMTAQDILSLAVNVAQNKWPLDESHPTAMRLMLDEIYEQVLEANRLAVGKRLAIREPR